MLLAYLVGDRAMELPAPEALERTLLECFRPHMHPEDWAALAEATEQGDQAVIRSLAERYGLTYSLDRDHWQVSAPYRRSM